MTAKPANRGSATYFARLLAAFGLTMALSYFLVILLLRTDQSEPPDPEAVARANQLRAFSNDLIQATHTYLERLETGEPIENRERWLQRHYLPIAKDIRQRIIAADLSGEAYLSLLKASDKVVAMGSNSNRTDLQSATKHAMLDARDKIEAEIALYRLEEHLTTQALALKFTRDE